MGTWRSLPGPTLRACLRRPAHRRGATLFLHGAKFVPAGVLVFLTLTEVVLAPVWVWAAFDEVPSAYTLAGGAIVLGAICIEAVLRVRHVDRP